MNCQTNLITRVAILALSAICFASPTRLWGQAMPVNLPAPSSPVEQLRFAFFAYDKSQPLNAALDKMDESASSVRYKLSYDSANDQRVTAIFAVPKKFAPPFPAVLLMHGSGGHKDADYIRIASDTLTGLGYATLSMDAQYRGDRAKPGKIGEFQPESVTMRQAWIQNVIDLRRAVDFLESRDDVNPKLIGYLGFSMGGMLGSVLGGVEGRIGCFLLAVPGGGFADLVKNIDKYPSLQRYWQVKISPEVIQRVEEFAFIGDPVHFVGRILPRPLLIIVAKKDELIPAESSQALIDAAKVKETEHVKRMDTGHTLTPAVIFDVRAFFQKHLGKREK